MFKLKTGFASIVSFIFDSIWTKQKKCSGINTPATFSWPLFYRSIALNQKQALNSSSTLSYFAIMLNPSYHGHELLE
ncbi:hypothetical protein NC653_007643 [Populus alba x Populus x berolinensis]|uniref:Uncharacterized protein n=1 Tax=Populus alba x Populus x berolinensis TaxID=444605 RepID=A0AAD6RHZ0_9ROSI|nr:hypothetical protein NC653_007643 [Populus alba x Populus x berolinensis]